MEVRLLSKVDTSLDVWKISRSHTLNKDEVTKNDLLKMNLPINQFKQVTLYFKTSILFRDLLFTFRPVDEWAKSNRAIKFNHDNLHLAMTDLISINSNILTDVKSKFDSVIDRVANGEQQDYVKEDLPLMTETEFCINVNYRTLINILYTFENHCNEYYKIFISELSKILPEITEDYQVATKADLFGDVALTDEELDIPNGFNKFGSTNFIKVNIKANLMAQFIRQHTSTIKNGLWNLVDKDFSKALTGLSSIELDCLAIISSAKLRNLASTRTCWFAQFDKSNNSSWSYVLGDYIQSLSASEFIDQLPCHGNCKKCKVLEDMIARSNHSDVNPPCPILLENPYIIDQRYNDFHSESKVFDKWKSIRNKINYNPNNKYNVIYSTNLMEAGTNTK